MHAAESEMRAAEAIDMERHEKKVLCQWLNGFLAASSKTLEIDPIDFAFSRQEEVTATVEYIDILCVLQQFLRSWLLRALEKSKKDEISIVQQGFFKRHR